MLFCSSLSHISSDDAEEWPWSWRLKVIMQGSLYVVDVWTTMAIWILAYNMLISLRIS